jgi:hypothetical protein
MGVGCRRTPPPRITVASVERCERGIEQAVSLGSAKEMTSLYYRECSQIQAEAPCQQAFMAASKAEPERQLVVAYQGCAAAYCPLFKDQNLEACSSGFQATDASLWRAWPPLHKAILTRDAGVYGPRIERALLQFLIALKAVPPAKTAAATDAAPPASAAADAAARGDAAAASRGDAAAASASAAAPPPKPAHKKH